MPPSERLGHAIDPFLERLILQCLAKRAEERPADAGALLQVLEDGWTGTAWTQREARAWWDTTAQAMLAARRASEVSVSREPKLAVNVSSRVASDRDSLPELSLQPDETAVKPLPTSRPKAS